MLGYTYNFGHCHSPLLSRVSQCTPFVRLLVPTNWKVGTWSPSQLNILNTLQKEKKYTPVTPTTPYPWYRGIKENRSRVTRNLGIFSRRYGSVYTSGKVFKLTFLVGDPCVRSFLSFFSRLKHWLDLCMYGDGKLKPWACSMPLGWYVDKSGPKEPPLRIHAFCT